MSNKYDKLSADFPELYAVHGYSRPEDPSPVYFAIGDGWFSLLYELSTAIMEHVRKNPEALPIITDIKEKYAGLRYYINGGDDVIDDLIEKAEDASYTICEQCGNPGEVMTRGYWLSTRCLEHKDENDRPLREVRLEQDENDRGETD
jgi:hypothetical protein